MSDVFPYSPGAEAALAAGTGANPDRGAEDSTNGYSDIPLRYVDHETPDDLEAPETTIDSTRRSAVAARVIGTGAVWSTELNRWIN